MFNASVIKGYGNGDAPPVLLMLGLFYAQAIKGYGSGDTPPTKKEYIRLF